MSGNIHKLIIIGSGPAGLTAAIYASRSNLQPLVLKGPKPGGQLMGTTIIENWPGSKNISGPELMITMLDQAAALGTQMIDETALYVDVSSKPFKITTQEGSTFLTHSAIIATGVTPHKLGCPGEDLYWGKGVSTCAVCDGAFYHKRKVIIVGGGDSAMESASFLNKYENDITVVHIKEAFTASHTMQQRVLSQPHIKTIFNSTVTEILGDGKNITGAIITNMHTKQTSKLEADGIFLAIGARPNSNIVQGAIDISSYGHIQTDHNVKTSVPGIFAAGDVHDVHYKQAIVSSAFGCMAAIEAERYIASLED